jgi:hypothetical protein
MPESASTDSRQYPQVRGARFAEGAGRFTGMPRMTQLACIRIRFLTLKASRSVPGLAAAAQASAGVSAGAGHIGQILDRRLVLFHNTLIL